MQFSVDYRVEALAQTERKIEKKNKDFDCFIIELTWLHCDAKQQITCNLNDWRGKNNKNLNKKTRFVYCYFFRCDFFTCSYFSSNHSHLTPDESKASLGQMNVIRFRYYVLYMEILHCIYLFDNSLMYFP